MMKTLVPHSPTWAPEFRAESIAISIALGVIAATVHHIGSTSIPGIHAKPIIDILVEAHSIESVDTKNSQMARIGYESMGEYGIPNRRYFRKINSQDTRTHHVHMFNVDSADVTRHLAFRDYLIAHPLKAQEYSALKLALAVEHKDDWERYQDGKDPFIKETEQIAIEWYRKGF